MERGIRKMSQYPEIMETDSEKSKKS